MSSWRSVVVLLLSLLSSLYSYIHFDTENPFQPDFVIFHRNNCCTSQVTALSNYIKSSNIPVSVNFTTVSFCEKVEGPADPYDNNEKGPIYVLVSAEEEEAFCNGVRFFTGAGIYRRKDKEDEWRGQIVAVQSPLLEVDKGLAIGDWPNRVKDSVEIRTILESVILLYQRRIYKKSDQTDEKNTTKETREKYKKGKAQEEKTQERQYERDAPKGLEPEEMDVPTEDDKLRYLWLFAIIPVVMVLIGAFAFYRYKQKRNQLLARKTYIKVVHKADSSAGNVQWHETSQSASEEDKSNSSNNSSTSKSGTKKNRSVKEFMHEYFDRLKSSD